MFLLKNIIAAFIKPPGVFIFAAFAVAVVLAVRRRWRAAAIAAMCGMILWVPAIRPVSDMLKNGLVSNIPGIDSPMTGDVIVVLGGGVDDSVRDPLGAPGVLAESATRRIVTAVQLHRRLGLPIIVTGGAPMGESITEAAVAARYLDDLGVLWSAIITEDQARDTRENARYVAALCRQRGYHRLLLVSSTYHLKRALMAFAHTGLDIRPVGDTGPEIADRSYRWNDFLPGSYAGSVIYLHEYLGMLAYRLAG